MFATTNTIGLGDPTGLYHGTQQINQGQMDRWNIVTSLNYLSHDNETEIVVSKVPNWDNSEGRQTIEAMQESTQRHCRTRGWQGFGHHSTRPRAKWPIPSSNSSMDRARSTGTALAGAQRNLGAVGADGGTPSATGVNRVYTVSCKIDFDESFLKLIICN